MKWNASRPVTLFFNQHELTKIFSKVLQKFKELNQGAIWPKELDQKKFSVLSAQHLMPGETEGPLSVFPALGDFFGKKIYPKGPPSICLFFATEILKSPEASFSAPIRSNVWVFQVL